MWKRHHVLSISVRRGNENLQDLMKSGRFLVSFRRNTRISLPSLYITGSEGRAMRVVRVFTCWSVIMRRSGEGKALEAADSTYSPLPQLFHLSTP